MFRFLLFLVVCFCPLVALGQALPGETVIVPDAAPPVMPKTDWAALITAGAGMVFFGVELVKKNLPIKGWWLFVSAIPITAGVALYQVGYADPKLLVKHAALVLFFTVGGRAGIYKIIEKWRAGGPAPELTREGVASVAPPPPKTPTLPPSAAIGSLLLMVVLGGAAGGCSLSARALLLDGTTYAHDVADDAAPRIENACVVELPNLKEPQWAERTEVCDVAVPANDELATAVVGAKKLLETEASDATMLEKAGQLATIAAKVVAAMAKIAVGAAAPGGSS